MVLNLMSMVDVPISLLIFWPRTLDSEHVMSRTLLY